MQDYAAPPGRDNNLCSFALCLLAFGLHVIRDTYKLSLHVRQTEHISTIKHAIPIGRPSNTDIHMAREKLSGQLSKQPNMYLFESGSADYVVYIYKVTESALTFQFEFEKIRMRSTVSP